MSDKTKPDQSDNPFSLASDQAYSLWRAQVIADHISLIKAPAVTIRNLSNPTDSETTALVERCQKTNLALYNTSSNGRDPDHIRSDLRGFSDAMGLKIAERHRSAGEHGIVALTVSENARQRGYIPYSRKAMNWHTDGYYNAPADQIRAMVLHCVNPATDGGANQLLDPAVAYIRLRDRNPDYVAALMHPQAMTIPENHEADGSVRPASIGPVFSIDQNSKLAMRYTARTRSIHWHEDELVKQAAQALQDILENNDPLMQTVSMKPGQGLLCNNVLHNRTGFDSDTGKASDRLIFRIRFHNRVEGN